MLPGKVYSPEDLLRILRKRAWLILVPWALVAAGTAVVARKLPDTYRSYATIQVIPPRVAGSIVSGSNSRPLERLQSIRQNILSRSKIEQLIVDLNLYQDEQKSGAIMQDLVERLRSEIKANPGGGDVFTVEYVGRDRRQVQLVAQKVAGFFINEGEQLGERNAEQNQSFMNSAVLEALRKLENIEEKVKTYKSQYAFELPEQLASNQSAVQSSLQQLSFIIASIDTDTNARMMIERALAELESGGDPGPLASPAGGETTASQRLEALQRELTGYKTRGYSDAHEEVKRTKAAIAVARKEADLEALRTPVASGGGASPSELARRRRIADLQNQLEENKKRVVSKQQEEKRLREAVATYQARVDRAPMRAAEMMNMTREYDVLNNNYKSLVNSREAADMSVRIETTDNGEQFKLLEEARVPERPFSPDRPRINFLGIMAGLAIGLGLVALLEYRDQTFKTDTELGGYLSLPVLAVVPLMMTGKEEKKAFRQRVLVNIACGSTVMVCVALLTYTFVY